MDINKLINWAAEIEVGNVYVEGKRIGGLVKVGVEAAMQILSHPDLALIDSCECGGNGYEEGGDGAPSWHVMCNRCCDMNRVIIPLAEAIRKSNEDKDN